MKKNLFSNHRSGSLMAALRGGALVSALCLLVGASPLHAAFKDSGWGVRPLGMGGAFTAVANDANGTLYNPAGLAQVSSREATFMSAKLFTGLEGVDIGQNYLGYIHPLNARAGTLGVTWSALSTPGLYREDSASVSYGRYVNDILRLKSDTVLCSLGANVKYLKHEYTVDSRNENNPTFSNGNSKGALTVDAGVLVMLPGTGFSVGIMGKNLTTPDIGLRNEDKVYNENAVGIAYYRDKLPYAKLSCFTVAADIVRRDKYTDYRIGAESWFFKDLFALRAGTSRQEFTFGLGYEFKIKSETKLIIDYAFALPFEVEKTSGSHRLGVSLRFP